MNPVLRRGDGLRNTPHLAGDVMRLQGLLDIDEDGRFGPGTEKAVEAFQRNNELTVDGIVGLQTWGALPVYQPVVVAPGLETFHGDLDWIHQWEGHVGRPYWPGGRSGVTLDPGFDLGHQTKVTLQECYPGISAMLFGSVGLRGHAARDWLEEGSSAKSLLTTRADAVDIFPHLAVRYWKPIGGRFPVLREPDTPGSVQTALLSLAYNRGARNKALFYLKDNLKKRRWLFVADSIATMQQDHELRGVRRRRREEAELIRQELEI